MPEQKKTGGPKKALKQDPLVDALRPDPSKPVPEVTELRGFLAKSDKGTHWRLYLTPRLNEYVEVATGDIVHSESLATTQDSLGGTLLFIKRSAKLQHTRIESRQVEAEMLKGEITGRFLSDTGVEALVGRGNGFEYWSTTACLGFAILSVVRYTIDCQTLAGQFFPRTPSGISCTVGLCR